MLKDCADDLADEASCKLCPECNKETGYVAMVEVRQSSHSYTIQLENITAIVFASHDTRFA